MTKISVYNIDEYVTADDKWIGTDVNTYNKTKNFTPRKLSNYFNGSQVINTGVDLLYKYFTITPPETRPTGTLSFETEIGPTVNFSEISTFLLSNTTLKGNYIVEFFDFLVGTNVLMYKAKNINLFGSYKIISVEEYLPEPNFFIVNVEFIEGNGFIEEDEDYMISLIDISSGGGSQNLQEVVNIGNSISNYGGIGNATIQSTNFSNNRTLYLNDNSYPTIKLEDNLDSNHYTVIDIDTLNLSGVSYPWSSIVGGSQNLQQVTDEGATTTNSITVDSLNYYSLVSPDAVGTEDKTTGSYAFLGAAGLLGLKNGVVDSILKNTNVTNNNVVLEFPNKEEGSYTIATTLDITTPSLQQVLDYNHDLIDGKNFQGIAAGAFATNANESNLFGTAAGYEATNADYSNFLGQNSGYQATNASSSNFFGFSAGREATYAGSSNFFGVNTGEGATSASNSNFFGANTGRGAIDANNSNFIGQQAGRGAVDASNSNFIGQSAGLGSTGAYVSNFFGVNAGTNATAASYSNFIGSDAGNGAINANNSNFIGNGAGNLATGANNSNFLGYQAGSSFTDNNIGSNNIIIGTNISLPDATINSINLGGVLFGTGTHSSIAGDPSIVPTPAGKIGIGIVSPTNTLHIYSETEDTSGLRLERLTSASPISTGQAIGVDASGNVVTVEGGGGGSQDLQSVLDNGGTAYDVNVNLQSEGGNTLTLAGGAGGSGTLLAYGTEENGTAIKAIGYDGIAINAQGGLGLALYAASIDESLTTDKNVDVANFVNNTLREEDLLYDCSAINVNTLDADGIRVYTNRGIGTTINQGASGKGLVINSGTSSTGVPLTINKNGVDKLVVNQAGELTATKLIKEGGFDYQFLKADGSVDNNAYLTSADLPSTLDLYATTSPDPVIAGYTALVRNIADSRYNTVAVDVLTPTITGTLASPTFCGAVISDPSILLGNPGVFNFSVIGKIRRAGGSTSSGADFFYGIYKRDLAGVETLIANSSPVVVPANGGIYVEYISIAFWNNGIFLSTDRVVLKFYGVKTGGGSGATYEFQFGGTDPVRGTAAISSAIIPNIYLKDLADVEKIPAENNEILYWNDSASLWEHELAENLVPLATATQKGLVSTTTQTFAGDKTFTGTITSDTVTASSINDYGVSAISQNSDGVSAESANGNGIVGVSTNATGGVFMTTNGANIAEFRTNFVEKAKIDSDGIITGTGLNASGQTINTIASFDGSKNVVSLPTATYPSLTELALVKGVSGSSIQTQLNGKAQLESPTFTGTVVLPSTTSIGTVSSTEIGYLDNVTSSIQTQLDNKIAKNVATTYTTNTITTVTAAEYAAIGTKDANTLYFIV